MIRTERSLKSAAKSASFVLLAMAAFASAEVRRVSGFTGPTPIPFILAEPSQVTIAIYDNNDRLVRTLGQLLPLAAGEHRLQWDGLDQWGNVVPAGTPLKARVISNAGVKAIYQMSVGSSGNPPWPTGRTGEGEDMRQGGHLGDHTGPSVALALGDKLFLGSGLSEHGHNILMANLKGEKMWGVQLEGWTGPKHLATDGRVLYAVSAKDTNVYSIDPALLKPQRLFNTGPDPVVAFTVAAEQMVFVLKNHEAGQDPFRRSKHEIEIGISQPTAKGGGAPEFQLSPASQITSVFTGSGHFQTGLQPVKIDETNALALMAFKQPASLGSVLLEKPDGVASIDIYTLREGTAYDAKTHGVASSLRDPGEAWQKFGTATFGEMVEVVAGPAPRVTTNALLIRLNAEPGGKKIGTLRMARLQDLRIERVPADIKIVLPDGVTPVAEKSIVERRGKTSGWDVVTDVPISEVAPFVVTLDLGEQKSFDGINLQNCTNPHVEILALRDAADPASAPEDKWESITKDSARHSKAAAWASAYTNANDRQIDFPQRVTARYLRLKFTAGILGGRGPKRLSEDPVRAACSHVSLLRIVDPQPQIPANLVQIRQLDGTIVSTKPQAGLDIRRLASDGKSVYGITSNALVQVTLNDGQLQTRPLFEGLSNPSGIDARDGKIAVSDRGAHAVHVFDTAGKQLLTIGNKGPYRPGPYDPQVLGRPAGLALAPDNTIWITEDAYHPKRIAQFSLAGQHLQDQFGPPEYGGGGYLDPNLKSFYYRGMEFGIDFATGTWSLKGFNDRYSDDNSPVADGSSFSYTRAGRVVYLKGRKYAIEDPGGQVSISQFNDDGSWRVAAVVSVASGSRFLTGRGEWSTHWLKQNLQNKAFIWADRNANGKTDIDEVELFDLPEKRLFSASYFGSPVGDDLTIFTTQFRLPLSRITDAGVPIYEAKDVRWYKYDQLAPIYTANLITNQPAKRGYGGASIVASDGSLAIEGQPYRVGPDLQIVGGAPTGATPTDYLPAVRGRRLDNPQKFVGSGMTTSPIGEVAMMNGVNGQWFLWSTRFNVVVGEIFTGRAGGWAGVKPERGFDATDHKQDWETFFGHFIKADDGNFYTVSGRGHHAISRIDNLNAYRLQEIPLTVSPEAFTASTQLREQLKAQAVARAEAAKQKKELDIRSADVTIDGSLDEWDTKKLATLTGIDDPPDAAATRAGIAIQKNRLVLAYLGSGVVKNSATDPKYAFKGGFCFEFAFRTDDKARGDDYVAGDKRLLVAPVNGQWTAVLFEYVDPSVKADDYMEYESPVAMTRVARVTTIPAQVVVKGDDVYSAEISIELDKLGLNPKPGAVLKGDFAVLSADVTGTQVDRRSAWANSDTTAITDMALEAAIYPSRFGTLRVPK